MKDRKVKYITDIVWTEREVVEYALLEFKHGCQARLENLNRPDNAWSTCEKGRALIKREIKRERGFIKATNQLLKKLPGRREYSADEKRTSYE